jgi:hypothetical protein
MLILLPSNDLVSSNDMAKGIKVELRIAKLLHDQEKS